MIEARQGWRTIVQALVATATVACLLSAFEVGRTGLTLPLVTAAGVLATVAVNRVYVVVHRHGDVREGIDLAEVPIVALALLLPPAQALLAFTLGSLIVELPMDRAAIKKAFNVGVRVTGAGALVLPLLLVDLDAGITAARIAAVVAGAFLYWVVNAGATAAVLASVQGSSAKALLRSGLEIRALVWAASTTVGVTAGIAADESPALLIGVAVLLAMLAATARVGLRAQSDSERLQGVLEATSGIQSAVGARAQDAALLSAARELLPWRDVLIRETPPEQGEVGRPLPSADDTPRWLLARPRPDGDPWSEQDDRVLETLACSASVTIELGHLQAHVAEQVMVDPLTGLGNRRRLDQELRRLCATDQPFAVLVLDLDGFKSINDRLGHEMGDAVLEQIAVRLRSACRDDDIVTRLGGDEFVLLLPGVDGAARAEAVARKVADTVIQPLQVGFWKLRVRTSVGVAIAPVDGRSPQLLLRRADVRMYDDKASNGGRSRDLIAVWQPVARRATDERTLSGDPLA